jgi:hypothetical protein
VGDFNTTLSQYISHPNKKINKEILELNHTIDQMNLAEDYRIFHQLLHNIHSSQQSMEPSPKLIISLGTKQASAKIRK